MTAAEPQLEAATRQALQWDELLTHLAGFCAGPVAAERLRGWGLAKSWQESLRRSKLVASSLELLRDGTPLPVASLEDQGPTLRLVQRGALLDGSQLRGTLGVMLAAADLRSFLLQQRLDHPELALALDSAPELGPLRDRLATAIEPDGTLSDRASPELRKARQRAADARRDLLDRLRQVMARSSAALQDQFYAERDGRYVLPVRSDSTTQVRGLVFGASGSGSTLYIEPEETIPHGNRLRVALATVSEEEVRILRELSEAVHRVAGHLSVAWESVLLADQLLALARYAVATDSVLVPCDVSPRLELHGARHPLLVLAGKEVVANSLTLEAGHGLIISGPNAGGKSVTLKTAGLLVWMAQASIPVPVESGSRIGWFGQVLSDVGDHQSLTLSLSTFSAHVRRLAELLAAAAPGVLLLLDEVAAGTDPEEGAILAEAVIEELLAQGGTLVITTHFERLKELAARHDQLRNASVGIDLDTMVPTFRLQLDLPGPSSALAIAKLHGMPAGVLARARQMLPVDSLQREALLRKLHQERETLERARTEWEMEERRYRLALEREGEKLERERAQHRRRLEEEARDLLGEVRRSRVLLAQAAQQLQKEPASAQGLKRLEKEVDQAAHPISVGGALGQSVSFRQPRPTAEGPIAVGAKVFLTKLGVEAEVLEVLPDGRYRLLAGVMKMLATRADLQLQRGTKPAAEKARTKKQEVAAVVAARRSAVRMQDNTLDLRGERVEAGLERIDGFIDELLRSGESAGYVLHGHGTGKMKLAVREHLGSHGVVIESYPADPEDGGDAFTVFFLRE